ncbi:MAG: transcription antitermination factor NusB [Ignavibacteriaceae bacterium]|nr:transcription antitermination factor NusB [Ignavibacteriaceae bacterium]
MSQIFKRRLVRERVLQALYAFELNKEGLQALTDALLADIDDKSDHEFGEALINRTLIHEKEIDKLIMSRVDNWEMNRIALLDKLLLRMGLCELIYFPDIPPKVSINECIEIGKIYSTAGSGKFINGILDALLGELIESGSLDKSGRGLVEESILKPLKKKLDEK